MQDSQGRSRIVESEANPTSTVGKMFAIVRNNTPVCEI